MGTDAFPSRRARPHGRGGTPPGGSPPFTAARPPRLAPPPLPRSPQRGGHLPGPAAGRYPALRPAAPAPAAPLPPGPVPAARSRRWAVAAGSCGDWGGAGRARGALTGIPPFPFPPAPQPWAPRGEMEGSRVSPQGEIWKEACRIHSFSSGSVSRCCCRPG